jgi:hypothetical protein
VKTVRGSSPDTRVTAAGTGDESTPTDSSTQEKFRRLMRTRRPDELERSILAGSAPHWSSPLLPRDHGALVRLIDAYGLSRVVAALAVDCRNKGLPALAVYLRATCGSCSFELLPDGAE